MNVPESIFDGVRNGFLPPRHPTFPEELHLHTEAAADVDAVTYEVVRSKLWNLNLEHAEALERASGSIRTVHVHDYQTSLHTEAGESVMFGPAIQYFAGTTDAAIIWTMLHRGVSPGIREGDVFLQNDPYIGCNHQMDTSVYRPVFWEGGLFCWVNSTCHWTEIGGVQAGSFTPQAADIFWEPSPTPPVKIVEGGSLRTDIEDLIRRRSRTPDICSLELRAHLAGLNVAAARVIELIGRYGAPCLKAVMRRMLDNTEQITKSRLRSLPDGTWRDVMYISRVAPGDRKLRKQVMTMVKAGERLTFSNAGTEPQFGSSNCSATTLRAAILTSMLATLGWDQNFCAGGLLRCLDLEPTPGTSNACTFPTAVTGTSAAVTSINQSLTLLSRMVACGPFASLSMTGSGLSTQALTGCNVLNRDGVTWIGNITDPGALGAFSFRDGVDFGGFMFNPRSRMAASVEVWEEHSDMLFLFRRVARSSGGHGRWRGGMSTTYALSKHKARRMSVSNFALATSIPTTQGLFGGYPASTARYYYAEHSGIAAAIAQGRIPASAAELRETAPDGRRVSGKETNLPIQDDSVWELTHTSTPGYGDPLRRGEQAVRDDLRHGNITRESAQRIYGVVFDEHGRLDTASTTKLRADMKIRRLATAEPPQRVLPAIEGTVDARVAMGDALSLCRTGGKWFFSCAACQKAMAPADRNYKEYAACIRRSLADLDAQWFEDPSVDVDDELVYTQYVCPGCGALLQGDLARRDDAPLWDIQMNVNWLDASRQNGLALNRGGGA
jgi:N-methylhydantoinase B